MDPERNTSNRARSAVPVVSMLVTATLFSTGGAAIKLVDLGAWQISLSRSLVAALFLGIVLPSARRSWRPATFAIGLAYAATLALFVHANKLTTAASTIFLQGAAPLYVVVLGPLVLDERLRRRDLVLAPVLALGLAIFFFGADPESSTAPHPLLGNVLAVLSGACYAFVILGLRWLGREDGSTAGSGAAAVLCGNLLAAVLCAPGAVPMRPVAASEVAILLYLGLFQIGLAYVLMVRAIRRLTALEASLLLLLEPALSPLWAWWLVDERPGGWTFVGGALLVGGTLFHAVATYRGRRR